MGFTRYTRRFLDSTRGQIISLLREKPCTVADLAKTLDLTNNAIRAHLVTLERDGLVRQGGERPGFRKPHFSYELTADAEDIFPKAYGRILNAFLDEIKKCSDAKDVEMALREVGHRMAASQNLENDATPDERLTRALKAIEDLGGQAHVEHEKNKVFIRGSGCPFSEATADHAEVCNMVEEFLKEIVGVPVRQCCQHEPSPQCCFEIGETKARG